MYSRQRALTINNDLLCLAGRISALRLEDSKDMVDMYLCIVGNQSR